MSKIKHEELQAIAFNEEKLRSAHICMRLADSETPQVNRCGSSFSASDPLRDLRRNNIVRSFSGISAQRDCLYFDSEAEVQWAYGNHGSGRPCIARPLCIKDVEYRPIFDRVDIDTHLNQSVDAATGGGQRRLKVG